MMKKILSLLLISGLIVTSAFGASPKANKIRLDDAGNIITAIQVEGALQENRTALDLNTTHRGSDGSDHTFIDQDVTITASPTFAQITDSGLTVNKGVYTDGSKQLISTAPSSGVLGHWDRTGTVLSPANAGDDIKTLTGKIIGFQFESSAGDASGDHAAAFGFTAEASGLASFAGGGSSILASGDYAAVSGRETTAQAYASFVIGRANVIAGSTTSWVDTDPLFVIGNGLASFSPNNAFTVLKNGNTTIDGTLDLLDNAFTTTGDISGGHLLTMLNPAGLSDDWISIEHDTANAILKWGSGNFFLQGAGGIPGVQTGDQSTARFRIQNINGEDYQLVAGVNGVTQSGFSIYDDTSNVTRWILDSSGNFDFIDGTIITSVDITAGQINSDDYYANDGLNQWGNFDGSVFQFQVDAATPGSFTAFDMLSDNWYDNTGSSQWGDATGSPDFTFLGSVELTSGSVTVSADVIVGNILLTDFIANFENENMFDLSVANTIDALDNNFETTGNIGAGISPTSKFHASSTDNILANLVQDNNTFGLMLRLSNSNAGADALAGYQINNGTSNIYFQLAGSGYTHADFAANEAIFRVDSATTGLRFRSESATGDITFQTNSITRLVIDQDGDIDAQAGNITTLGNLDVNFIDCNGIDSTDKIRVDATTSANGYLLELDKRNYNLSSGSTQILMNVTGRASTGGSITLRGQQFDMRYLATQNQTGTIEGSLYQMFHSGSGNTAQSTGLRADLILGSTASASLFTPFVSSGSISNGLAGTVTTYRGHSDSGFDAEDGTTTNAFGFYSAPHRVDSGSLTNAYGAVYEKQIAGGTNNASIWLANDGIGSDILFGGGRDVNIYFDGEDLIINSNNVTANDEVHFTNFDAVVIDSDLLFTGAGKGLAYGEISAQDNTTPTIITTSGKVNKVQVTIFDTDGLSNNATPDHTNDHITINKAGVYKISVSMSVESVAGDGDKLGFSVYKNNGATEFPNLHFHRDFTAGASKTGSASMNGIISVSVNDTIEIWGWNENDNDNFLMEDVTSSITQIGG